MSPSHSSTARSRRASGLLVAWGVALILTSTATGVWAHPAFRPAEISAGTSTELELVLEHDCEVQGGGSSPTIFVAVEIPDTFVSAEAIGQPGWEAETVRDDGRVTELLWTATDDAPPGPPTLRLAVTPDTQVEPAEFDLKVFQACEEGDYLWGAGSADRPPVRLTVAAGTLPPSASPTSAGSEPTTEPTPAASTKPDPSTTPTEDDTTERATTASNWPLAAGGILALGLVGAWIWWTSRDADRS